LKQQLSLDSNYHVQRRIYGGTGWGHGSPQIWNKKKKKKSAVEKKIVYWSPHKNKQTPVPPSTGIKQTPVPPLEKTVPMPPQKKNIKKKKKKTKESKTSHLPPKKNQS
jgi:hypothetical protein